MAEFWKNINGYGGKYQISNYGRVYGVSWNRILKPKTDKDGYFSVCLMNPYGKRKHERVHRLVALHYCDKPKDKTIVNHKNMIKTDNRSENLEWVTVQENTKHAYDNSEKFQALLRENTKKAAKVVTMKIRVTQNGIHLGDFYGKEFCAKQLGISPKTIYNGINGKYKSRQGYEFELIGGDANADRIK